MLEKIKNKYSFGRYVKHGKVWAEKPDQIVVFDNLSLAFDFFMDQDRVVELIDSSNLIDFQIERIEQLKNEDSEDFFHSLNAWEIIYTYSTKFIVDRSPPFNRLTMKTRWLPLCTGLTLIS